MPKIAVRKVEQNKTYLTQEGLIEARRELAYLQKEKRVEVADRIEKAREFGDTEENAEYDAALDEQTLVENRILYLEEVLRNAQVIAKEEKSDFVVIGSTVKIQMDGEIDEFTIVGKLEANPMKKKISNESPVGHALLGARLNEVVEVATPIVRYKVKVLAIK